MNSLHLQSSHSRCNPLRLLLPPVGFTAASLVGQNRLSRRITCQGNMASPPTLRPVTISFSEIKDRTADLSMKIEEGFGPSGLGIISISEVPGYSSLRQNLLRLSPRLACLPEETKKKLEDPDSRYNFGWSHGKEKLESGKLDMLKGSFYANPVLDVPTTEASLVKRYPSYCGSNIWPDDALPELEQAFKALGKLILDVGLMVAYHCDKYVRKGIEKGESGELKHILARSRCHKGRLLYYFPADNSECTESSESMSSWCGWHTDHGSLTGLTCAMFMKDGFEVSCPDSAAGLYIRTRTEKIDSFFLLPGSIQYRILLNLFTFLKWTGGLEGLPAYLSQVTYGKEEIAYQIGETTEILSRGYLCATPHCVRAPKGEPTSGVDRSTFALFMQPDWDEKLNFPDEVHIHKELIASNRALTFGEYSELLLDKYYHART